MVATVDLRLCWVRVVERIDEGPIGDARTWLLGRAFDYVDQ